MGMNYEQEYNRVMSLLRNAKMPHGLCEPRERKACTHCNAVEELDRLIAEYKGARIVLADTAPLQPQVEELAKAKQRCVDCLKVFVEHDSDTDWWAQWGGETWEEARVAVAELDTLSRKWLAPTEDGK